MGALPFLGIPVKGPEQGGHDMVKTLDETLDCFSSNPFPGQGKARHSGHGRTSSHGFHAPTAWWAEDIVDLNIVEILQRCKDHG